MSIVELTQSCVFKKLMHKIWRWSIAIAIVGGIFIINGWPFGNMVLSVGGIFLVIVYFFAGFEPLHEDIDWTLVFPQLAGISEDVESALTDPLTEVKKLRQEVEELKKELNELKKKSN